MEKSNTELSQEDLYEVPYSQRWELLKPVLERLYLDEKVKLPVIISLMKATYSFDAK
jgi:hypothetical protein